MATPPGTYMPYALRQTSGGGGGGGFRYSQRPPEKEDPWERLAFGAAQEVVRAGVGFGTQAFGAHLEEEAAKAQYARQVERDEAAEVRKRELIEGTYENEQMLLRNFGGAKEAKAAQSQAQAAAQSVYADHMKAYQGEMEEYRGAKETAAQKERDTQAESDDLYRQIGREAVDVRAFEDPFGATTGDYDVLDRTVPAPGIGPPETTGGVAFTKPGTFGVGGRRLPLEGPGPVGGGRIDEPLRPLELHGEWARTGEGQQPPVQVHRGDRPRPVSQAAIGERDLAMNTGLRADLRADKRAEGYLTALTEEATGTTAPSKAYPTSGRDVAHVPWASAEGEPPGGYTGADDYPPPTTRAKAVAARERPRSTAGEVPDRLLPTTLREPKKPTTAAPKKPVAPTLEDVPLQETEGQKRVRQQREIADLQRKSKLATEKAKLLVEEESARIGASKDSLAKIDALRTKLITSMTPNKKGKINEKLAAFQLRSVDKMIEHWKDKGAGGSTQYEDLVAERANLGEAFDAYVKARKRVKRVTQSTIMVAPAGTTFMDGSTHITHREFKKQREKISGLLKGQSSLHKSKGMTSETLQGSQLWIYNMARPTPSRDTPQHKVTAPRVGDIVKGVRVGGTGLTGPKATTDRINKLAAQADKADAEEANRLRDDARAWYKMASDPDIDLIDPETGQWNPGSYGSAPYKQYKKLIQRADAFETRQDKRREVAPTKTPSAAGQVQPRAKSPVTEQNQAQVDKIVEGIRRGSNPVKFNKDARDAIRLSKTSPNKGEHEAIKKQLEAVMSEHTTTVVDVQAAALREGAPMKNLVRWHEIVREELGPDHAKHEKPVNQAKLMVDQKISRSRMFGTPEAERQSLLDDADTILDNMVIEGRDLIGLEQSDMLRVKQLRNKIRSVRRAVKGRAKKARGYLMGHFDYTGRENEATF